jgi:dienelactone hydrolase
MKTTDANEKLKALRAAFEIDQHPLVPKSAKIETRDGYVLETLGFETAVGESVRGFLTRPLESVGPLPAVLYIHAHGGNYDIGAEELLSGRAALLSPLGALFARGGMVALCIDLPCFGTRQHDTESALAKARIWHGKSLAGQMIGELSSALGYLGARPEVDASHIAAFGISMGATFSYWLGAADPRIAAVAQLCCFADFDTMISLGAHDGHGIYLSVPGLLDLAGNGEIAGLVAPRPQFIGLGGKDPLTPPDAVAVALRATRSAYAAAGAGDDLVVVTETEGGHAESPAIRDGMFAFLDRTLGSHLQG